MLKTSEPKPLGIGGNYRPALPWLGEGLLLAGGAIVGTFPRLLTLAFHFEILKPYQTIITGLIDTYAETGKVFELFQLISNCTLDIILQCAFSYQTDCQKDRDHHPYCRAISNVANMVATRNRQVWKKLEEIKHKTVDMESKNVLYFIDFIWNMSKPGRSFNKDCDYIHGVADEVIESRKQVLAAGKQEKKKYLDFLDILLSAKDETGIGLSPADIRAEVDTFMFEGHDTTTSGISWILYELAKNQSYQKLCQQEVDKVLRDSNDFVTWENLSQFDILTQCIKEGMRIHPPVPIVSRQSTKEVTIEGVTFPPDTTFSVNIYGLHHNPAVWKDHTTYDPSRFSKDRDSVLDSYAFIPFSAGPRNCIGQNFAMNEEKTVIARILERYTLKLDPNHTAEEQTALVMRAQNGIHCKAIICIRFYVNFERKKKFFDNLPGYSVTEKHWLTGHISLYVKNNSIDLEELQSLVKRFPNFFVYEPKPLGIGGNYRPALPWLGEGLLLAGGAKWARSRRLLTPAFHFEILKPYQTIYNSCTDKLLGLIDTYAETGESFELFQLISNCTLDSILQCAFSYQTDCQKDRNVLYVIDFIWNMSKPGRSFNKDCDYIHGVADEVIESSRKTRKEEIFRFLDILLSAKDETGIGLSPADIRAEVDTFMFEVYKGRNEIHPPVPIVSRQSTKAVTIEGVTFPPDTTFSVNIYGLHHNPAVWKDHTTYDPSRFSKDRDSVLDSYAFIPFSAGPRNCIGQNFAMNEEKTVIARILERYTLKLDPNHTAEEQTTLVMRAQNGIHCKAIDIKWWFKSGQKSTDGLAWLKDNLASKIGHLDNSSLYVWLGTCDFTDYSRRDKVITLKDNPEEAASQLINNLKEFETLLAEYPGCKITFLEIGNRKFGTVFTIILIPTDLKQTTIH
ncbi:CYP4B1 [Mytilus edulis]|uniref:CYP4B1 n=1 Tax=Mytilus edulis TaxID=6550 RepID=A0A8S3RKW4_MYTED|nr:CYP4B1 [Mytilus edulis]